MVDKIDAARRQIECAIRLVAAQDDDLAIHTLTMAAFGVLDGLAKGNTFYEDGLKPEFSNIGKRRLWDTANFLKHADRDPEGVLESLDPAENDWRIGFCLLLYRSIKGTFTPTMAAFHFWMLIRHPDNFMLEEDKDPEFEQAYREAIGFQKRQGRPAEIILLNANLKLFHDGLISPNSGLRRRSHHSGERSGGNRLDGAAGPMHQGAPHPRGKRQNIGREK